MSICWSWANMDDFTKSLYLTLLDQLAATNHFYPNAHINVVPKTVDEAKVVMAIIDDTSDADHPTVGAPVALLNKQVLASLTKSIHLVTPPYTDPVQLVYPVGWVDGGPLTLTILKAREHKPDNAYRLSNVSLTDLIDECEEMRKIPGLTDETVDVTSI